MTPVEIDLPALQEYLVSQEVVLAAYLFGSVARGRANHLSDVDIAVLLKPDIDMQDTIEYQLQLLAELEKYFGKGLQVTILNSASLLFTYQVIREGVLLYEQSHSDRIGFEVRALQLYFDFKPRLDFLNQAVMKRIREVGLGRRKRHSTRALEAARQLHQRLEGASKR